MGDYLTRKQKQELLNAHRVENEVRYSDRIRAILYLSRGLSYEEVAEFLMCDERSIRRYESLYFSGGIEALLSDGRGGSSGKLTEEERKRLKEILTNELCRASKKAKDIIKKEFGKDYSISGTVSLLHSLGFRYKQPKVMPKADPKLQEEFVDKLKEIQVGMSEEDELLFVDAVHAQHATQVTHGWIPKDEEVLIPANSGRKRVNINGALNSKTNKLILREDKTINADSFIELLKQVAASYPKAENIHIVLDNARYYRAVKVREFIEETNIRLHFLPPYSPNLNLIERVWGFLKRECIYNRYFDSYDEFKQAIIGFLDNMHINFKEQLQKLLTWKFNIITAPAT